MFDKPLPDELAIGVVDTYGFCDLPAGFGPDEPLYVLTDIHGCSKVLNLLLEHKPADTRLVFLGDAVDRGPDPLGVIGKIMSYPNVVLLHGNHDAMAWYAQDREGEERDGFLSKCWAN